MKKILLVAVLLVAFAVPAFGANYYIQAIVWTGSAYTTEINLVLNDAVVVGDCIVANVASIPTFMWALTKVECNDPSYYGDLMNNANIDMLPMVPFDVKMNAMAMDAMNNYQAVLTKYGVTGNCDREESCRLSIRCVGQQIIPAWTEAEWSYF